jgi:hypothetical protein
VQARVTELRQIISDIKERKEAALTAQDCQAQVAREELQGLVAGFQGLLRANDLAVRAAPVFCTKASQTPV